MNRLWDYVAAVLLVLAALTFTVKGENYWERRSLNCTYREGHRFPSCKLFLRKEFNRPLEPNCFEEPDPKNRTRIRYTCPLKCPDAYSDSVTLKIPQWRHNCISHYTYGTDKVTTRDGGTDRYMWKIEPCLYEDVELSIWCKFEGRRPSVPLIN